MRVIVRQASIWVTKRIGEQVHALHAMVRVSPIAGPLAAQHTEHTEALYDVVPVLDENGDHKSELVPIENPVRREGIPEEDQPQSVTRFLFEKKPKLDREGKHIVVHRGQDITREFDFTTNLVAMHAKISALKPGDEIDLDDLAEEDLPDGHACPHCGKRLTEHIERHLGGFIGEYLGKSSEPIEDVVAKLKSR